MCALLLHTVLRELDGLKHRPDLRVALELFLRPGGSRDQCAQRGVLAEAPRSGARTLEAIVVDRREYDASFPVQRDDAMVLNVARFVRQEIMRQAAGAGAGAAAGAGAGAGASVGEAAARRSVLLLTDDAGMLAAARAATVRT